MEYKTYMKWSKLMIVKDSGKEAVKRYSITSSKDIYNLATRTLSAYFGGHNREEFVIILLDGKNRMSTIHSVSVGCLTASIVHPREVFKMAILGNAASLILCHNHPSGDANPSNEDIEITKRLVAAGDLLGIKILDHVIIGEGSYVSFADKGLL